MTEKILMLRHIFNELPKDIQFREMRRMERIVNNKPLIKMRPLGKSDLEQSFHTMTEVVKFLQNNGYPKANSSNIYKVLKNTRTSVYEHEFYYDYD